MTLFFLVYGHIDVQDMQIALNDLIESKYQQYNEITIENKTNVRFTNALANAVDKVKDGSKAETVIAWLRLKTARISSDGTEDYIAADTDSDIYNAPKRLLLIDSYGYNDGYHPKVISFARPWHGYRYWLVWSPFPDSNEKYENPHLLVSNDMLHWEEQPGFSNPIADIPEDYLWKKIYNSDPHILYNSDTDQLEIWWRYVNDLKDQVIIYRSISDDGLTWSNRQKVLTATRSLQDYLSPAVMYEDGRYKLWYVQKNRRLAYTESNDLINWQPVRLIEINYEDDSLHTWHIDVITTEKGYEMLISAYTEWRYRENMDLYYSWSEDNSNYTRAVTILKPTLGTDLWDNRGIYRSSLLWENGRYYLFYSASSTYHTEGIGLMNGAVITDLRPLSDKQMD